jgi:hypothetical protein
MYKFTPRLIARTTLQTTRISKLPLSTSAITMNQSGQGTSHATGDSKVPHKVQEQVPKGVEESLPDSVSILNLNKI